MNTLVRFLAFYKPYIRPLVADLFCAALLSAIDIFWPLLFSWCTSVLFVSRPPADMLQIGQLTAFVLLLYVIRSWCKWYVTVQGHIMGTHMEADMRRDLFLQLERLSFSWHDRHNTGELSARIISDLFEISEFAHHGPENVFICTIKIIGSLAVMFWMNVPLAACMLAVILVMIVFSRTRNYKMNASFLDNRRKIALVNSQIEDSLAGIRIVKSFSNEARESAKFQDANDQFVRSKEENYHQMGIYYTGNNFFQGLLHVLLVSVGGMLVVGGSLSVEDLVAFALYVNVIVQPVQMLVEFSEMFQKGFSGFQRFVEVMDEVPEIQDVPGAGPLKPVKGEIMFQDVSFGYDKDRPVLDHFSLTIPAGTKAALVGPSGEGKTTVCGLLSRFYAPASGTITIDGQDIAKVTQSSLHDAIGLVSQDVYLFDGTIEENIAYGRPGALIEEIREAARKAHIANYIESLPDKYQTRCGQRGVRLSGGQKQRIAIARIFLKDPAILLLDEATSALDMHAEREVQQALDALAKDRTCITIAHRLSTVRNADCIHVLEQGKIVEQGRHDQLLQSGGLYASWLCYTGQDSPDPSDRPDGEGCKDVATQQVTVSFGTGAGGT